MPKSMNARVASHRLAIEVVKINSDTNAAGAMQRSEIETATLNQIVAAPTH